MPTGKLPAILNWTTGPNNLAHAAKLMGLTHVVTSKAFEPLIPGNIIAVLIGISVPPCRLMVLFAVPPLASDISIMPRASGMSGLRNLRFAFGAVIPGVQASVALLLVAFVAVVALANYLLSLGLRAFGQSVPQPLQLVV